MVENIVLLNNATSATLELDKVTTPNYILDVCTWGEIQSTHHSYKYVNQVGVYVTGTSLETRPVEITGWIVANNEDQMTSLKTFLNRFVNPQQLVTLSYKEYKLDFLPDTSVKYSATVVENNDVVCKFKIEGTAPDPLFRISNENQVAAATTRGLFHFPMILNKTDLDPPRAIFGLREPSLIIDVYNGGAVGVGMKLVFKALGTVTGPTFTNVETQEYFKINKTLVAGEQIVINTNIGEKSIKGTLSGVTSNYFKYRDFGSTWLQLGVGDNLFRYDADANVDALEAYVYFYNKYLEVQGCY